MTTTDRMEEARQVAKQIVYPTAWTYKPTPTEVRKADQDYERRLAPVAEIIATALSASEAKGRQDGVREGMKRGFLAGFNASGEGWNGEYPFGDRGIDPETDENFIATRDFALSNIDEANQ